MERRFSGPVLGVVLVGALLVAVSIVARFGGALGIPGADDLTWLAEEPVHYGDDPSGWEREEAAGVSFTVPGDWDAVPEGGLKDGYAASWHSPDGDPLGELSVLDYPGDDTGPYQALIEAASLERGEELDLPLGTNDGCQEYDLPEAYAAGLCAYPASYTDPGTGEGIAVNGTYYVLQTEQGTAPVLVRLLRADDFDADDAMALLNGLRPAPDGWRAWTGD
ncbi:hypothetical protein [Nocardiopsis suaedae]|uniref:Uncharacterized protein n=1 Tax=Nocardiopsis suaedae TaxID=3018444 RepID=A0ABT4TI63_9ACTN|nr:hypothetical protein [Nocardiopsis suaedae]MDA2804400.1 hypothetical protein [Nocardiopsis suaedae]